MGGGFSSDYTSDREAAENEHREHLATLAKAGDLIKNSERIAHKPVHIMVESSYEACLDTFRKNLVGALAGAQLLQDVVDGFCDVYMSVVREIFHGEMQVMERRKGSRTCSQSKTSGGFQYHFIISAKYQYMTTNSVYENRSDGQRARDYAKSTLKLLSLGVKNQRGLAKVSGQMGNSFESWYSSDSSAIHNDHDKHVEGIALPKKDTNMLLSRAFNFPVDGGCNAIIAKVSHGFETIVERGDLHPIIHQSLTDSLTSVVCEVVRGEYAVVGQARGKREVYNCVTTGAHDYYLVSTIRYYVSTVRKVERLPESGIGTEIDLENTQVRAYVCSVITVLQKPTDFHEEVRKALPQGVFELPNQLQGTHEERKES